MARISTDHGVNAQTPYRLLLEPRACFIELQQPLDLPSLVLQQFLREAAHTLLELELHGFVQALAAIVHIHDGAARAVDILICSRDGFTAMFVQEHPHAPRDEAEVLVAGANGWFDCPACDEPGHNEHEIKYALGVPTTLMDIRLSTSATPARVLDAEAESESRSRRGTLWRGDADPSRSLPPMAGSALNALDVPGKLRSVKTSVIVED